MVMPALFGGFGNQKLLIINTLYPNKYINYNNVINSLVQNKTKTALPITTSNNDNNDNNDYQQRTSPQLGPYLAGLIEGDGHIYVPDTFRGSDNKIRYCFIRLVLAARDLPFLLFLQSKLGGVIVNYTTYHTLQFNAFHELIFIINLINGHMRTPKIEALYRLIKFLRSYYPFLPVDDFKSLDKSPIDSNAWLSGLWDADGNFNIIISPNQKRAVKYRVQKIARLELRTTYHYIVNPSVGETSFQNIMQTIANFFGVSLYYRNRFLFNDNRTFYYLLAHSITSHKVVATYFSQFPLFSSKYHNYLRWLEIHQMQLKGVHNTAVGLEKCKVIKNDFNKKLAGGAFENITWCHLSKFYI